MGQSLSRFIMESRDAKSKAETDLRQRLQANTEAAEFARRQLAELSAGPGRLERDAVIVVHKSRPAAGTVRLGYLVGAATWSPQYRLRGGADNAPVRLEYLAAVVQQTGEDWPDVRATLSTTRPSLDAAPPELLPLTMAIDDSRDSGPLEPKDDRSQKIVAELGKLIDLSLPCEPPLEAVNKIVRTATKSATFPEGIPMYVDPLGLQEAEKTMTSPVVFDVKDVPFRTSLALILKQLGLAYTVKDGLLSITSQESLDEAAGDAGSVERSAMGGMAGMGGMGGGMGLSLEQAQAAGGAMLKSAAATDQVEELRIADKQPTRSTTTDREGPSAAFPISGPLTIPSRRNPQLLDVARVELAADYFAKATPVLTPRVYRLAKLTNQSDLVLLPGEATVYVGSDFVGRMNLPLVAAGEPFIAGFGVDPHLQVSRHLVHKGRSVQGGNQVFDYEFRLGLRNYRTGQGSALGPPAQAAGGGGGYESRQDVGLSKHRWPLPAHGPDGQPAAVGLDRAARHGRRQDDLRQLQVSPGIRSQSSAIPVRLRRPLRRPRRGRRHEHGRHGWHAIGQTDGTLKELRSSRQQFLAYPAVPLDADEPSLQALVREAELNSIKAQEVEDGGLEIVDGDRVLGDLVIQVVSSAREMPGLNPPPATQRVKQWGWWSRPRNVEPPRASFIEVRPNSPPQITSVSSSSPRCFRSVTEVLQT